MTTGSNDSTKHLHSAIEHAEYMAVGAEYLLTQANNMVQATNSMRDVAEQDVFEAASRLHRLIYEFRKRRDLAVFATPPATPAVQPKEKS